MIILTTALLECAMQKSNFDCFERSKFLDKIVGWYAVVLLKSCLTLHYIFKMASFIKIFEVLVIFLCDF